MRGDFEVRGRGGDEVGGDLAIDRDERGLLCAVLDGLVEELSDVVERRDEASLESRERVGERCQQIGLIAQRQKADLDSS